MTLQGQNGQRRPEVFNQFNAALAALSLALRFGPLPTRASNFSSIDPEVSHPSLVVLWAIVVDTKGGHELAAGAVTGCSSRKELTAVVVVVAAEQGDSVY
jgi:hypothetical protein